jgi:hypothetical protein
VSAPECDCHKWYDTEEIGGWYDNLLGARASQPKLVRDVVATEAIWDRSEMSRDELTAAILKAGRRISHDYALGAWTLNDGRVSLNNGVHRWAIATELGIVRIPVEMHTLPSVSAWPWP